MSGFNKVILLGRLGRTPELRTGKGGKPYCMVSLCISEKRKDKESGETVENQSWVSFTLFGQRAERFCEKARKGNQVFFEGKIRDHKYERDGKNVYTMNLMTDRVSVLFEPKKEQSDSESNSWSKEDIAF